MKKAVGDIFCSLSMVLNEHDIVIVKGKNGSGKTSFLKCLAGIITLKKEIYYGMEKNISCSGA